MKIASSSVASIVAALSVACGLGACGNMKLGENAEAQAVVTRKVTGMAVGDFIERYGAPLQRSTAPDGILSFDWASSVGYVAPGLYARDDRQCFLHVVADKAGRIVSATVTYDYVGLVSTSRCTEVFR